jgi:CBS domain-containing protein
MNPARLDPSSLQPPSRDIVGVSVSEIMTSGALCVRETATLASAMALMVERSIGALPVVDADGRAIGILSKADVLRSLLNARDGASVSDVMTTPVLSVHEEDPVDVVAAFMAYERVHHVPILDDHRRVVGMVSSLDVTRWLARKLGFVFDRR